MSEAAANWTVQLTLHMCAPLRGRVADAEDCLPDCPPARPPGCFCFARALIAPIECALNETAAPRRKRGQNTMTRQTTVASGTRQSSCRELTISGATKPRLPLALTTRFSSNTTTRLHIQAAAAAAATKQAEAHTTTARSRTTNCIY